MNWNDNPREEFILYFLRKWGWGASFLLLPALLGETVIIPDFFRQVFDAPMQSMYTPAGAPSLQIAIHTDTPEAGGMTAAENTMLKNILDILPESHLAGLKFIGVSPVNAPGAGGKASEPGAILINNSPELQSSTDGQRFQQIVSHEIGHTVENGLSSKYQSDWLTIHQASMDQPAFVIDHEGSAQEEDFADNYQNWVSMGSYSSELNGVLAAQGNNPAQLQKFLFMAGLFTNPDGTVNFYSPVTAAAQPGFTPIHVERLPHYRTADLLSIGFYVFRLQGDTITSIEDQQGDVIADHLSIPIPQILLDRWAMTGPPPPSTLPPTQSGTTCAGSGRCQPRNASEDPTLRAPGLEDTLLQVVSPNDPRQYVPLQSKAGYQALAGEQAVAHPNHQLTSDDEMRPHGLVSLP